MSGEFGPVFNMETVAQWVLDLAEEKFRHYLGEAERQQGDLPQKFAPLKSFVTANEWGEWPEQHLPCLLVTDTGVGDSPMKDGRGIWRCKRLYGAAVIVQAPTRKEVRWASGTYAAAFRTMLLQHPSLNGHGTHVCGLDWADERPAPIPTADTRNVQSMNMLFYVDLRNVVDERGLPPDSDVPPYEIPDPPPVIQPRPEDPPPNGGNPHDPELPAGGSRVTIRTKEIISDR